MLFAELVPLTRQLADLGFTITIETAGTLDLPVRCDLMSISPKLSNSTPIDHATPRWAKRHDRARFRPDVIQRLTTDYPYQLKFVIDTEEDLPEVEAYLTQLGCDDPSRIWLMPQGVEQRALARRGAWLAEYCQRRQYQFCPRRHIEWFGNVRGT